MEMGRKESILESRRDLSVVYSSKMERELRGNDKRSL